MFDKMDKTIESMRSNVVNSTVSTVLPPVNDTSSRLSGILSHKNYGRGPVWGQLRVLTNLARTEEGNVNEITNSNLFDDPEIILKNHYYFSVVEDDYCWEYQTLYERKIDFNTISTIVQGSYERLYKYVLCYHEDLEIDAEFFYSEPQDGFHKYAMNWIKHCLKVGVISQKIVRSVAKKTKVPYKVIYIEHYRVKMESFLKPDNFITDSVPVDLRIMYQYFIF